MSGVEERLDKVEERLGSVEKGVNELRGEVGTLRGEVGTLSDEVQKLRVLGEQNTSDIKLVAEVQARHGEKLEEITKALEPLARIDNFIGLVADEHEVRIKRLEKRAGI